MRPALKMLLIWLVLVLSFATVIWLSFWLTRRWLGPRAELSLGLIGLAYFAYDWLRMSSFCSAPPVYLPPTAEGKASGSIGEEVFNCDGPGGRSTTFISASLAPC